MKLSDNQKKVLHLLLDKYERSKTYQGTNQVSQSFSAEPAEVWPEYVSDFADIKLVHDFEQEMGYLQTLDLITIQGRDGAIVKILAQSDRWPMYYELLSRKRKSDIAREQTDFFEGQKSAGKPLILSFCDEQLERIDKGKKPEYPLDVCEKIIGLLDYILDNTEELLERELSTLILSDSKAFGEKYRSKICKILCKYAGFSDRLEGIDDAREREKIVLEEFKVYANPSYVHLKGRMELCLTDGRSIVSGSEPLALSSDFIKKLASVRVRENRVVTVENLTSFHRINEPDSAYIYLAGYHNSEKQALLRKIWKENPCKKWHHFGDIDPDGFYILEHLIEGTGIEFEPLHMDAGMLEKYAGHCRMLTERDKVKAENLIRRQKYAETLQYMLDHNCKLEQEIISWNSMSQSFPMSPIRKDI